VAESTLDTIRSLSDVHRWASDEDRPAWRVVTLGKQEAPDGLLVHDGRVSVAIVGQAAHLPDRFDAAVVAGSSSELADAIARIESRHVQLVPLPCPSDLLRRVVEQTLSAARAFNLAKVADRLLEIGLALNAERDPRRVLELILEHARALSRADAGSIYLVEDDGQSLRFTIAENDSVEADFSAFTVPVTEDSVVGTCVLTGHVVSIPDLYVEGGPVALGRQFQHDRSFDERFGYQTRSMLTIPMRPPGGQVLGVIQLINAKSDLGPLTAGEDFERRVVPFSAEDERLCLSLAAQGAVALESARLYAEIQTLFEGFVRASVVAIEQRDPTTSGHSQRVADLTVKLAETVDGLSDGDYADVRFSRDQLREIQYAGLLHDFGKVGVREQVLVKAKKLFEPQLELVMARFDHMHTVLQLELLEKQLERARRGEQQDTDLRAWHQERARELDEMIDLVLAANEPTVLQAESSARIRDVAQQEFRSARGLRIRLLEDEDVTALLVRKGSLTEAERVEIQGHVAHTYNFLVRIPWGQTLSDVPEIAGRHHEYLDGSGYPHRVQAGEISIQSRMMTICDIFDALTAADRPYKKAVPVELAIKILSLEARDGKIDPDLLDVFTNARIYEAIGLSLE
jgi:HD-GYP domain-containing protein (c-di-GMP phosphodiesterase class II)